MRKPTWIQAGFFVASLAVLGVLVYQVPAVNHRLSWRVDFALTYLRGIIDPVEEMPTALPQPVVLVTKHPTETPEVTPTPGITASPTPGPTPTRTPTPTPIPGEVSLPAPAYEKQDVNNCGPATLSIYLRYYGWEGDQYDIASLTKPNSADRNVNVEELMYFVNTKAGWLNAIYRVGGDIDLLKSFLAAGIPVMIEEGFDLDQGYWPGDDQWAGHYLFLNGYDDAKSTFTAQDSFRGPDQIIPFETVKEHWQAFNYVYILLYPPEQQGTVEALLGDNQDEEKNRQHALELAQAETESEPENAYAWFNLGTNLIYFERYAEAGRAYDTARELDLPQRMLRYQFGPFFAYFFGGRNDDLLALTEYALKRTPNSEEAKLWRGWGMYRAGKSGEAIDLFNSALEDNPTDEDVLYALQYVQENP